jgi:undecaprenyl-diphosphatase
LLIGLAQGLAIIPGVSRSGSTIGTGLLLGIDRDKGTRFSFLLSIPAVIGAGLLEARNIVWINFDLLPILAGVITSALVGYVSLKLLLRFVQEKNLRRFSWYCWLVGILILSFYFLV